MDPSPRFRLTLLGSPQLAAADGTLVSGGAAQRHRLALLAMLARSPDCALGREVLMAHLWPETDPEQARNRMKVSVYALRQALGDDALVSAGDVLRLDVNVVGVDARDFESALEQGEPADAVTLYRGPFMEGFFLRESAEFDHWLEGERSGLASAYAKALQALAEEAEARGDPVAAVERWKALAAHDPYDSRVAVRLMEAFAASGNRAAALRHASIHGRLLVELGLEPSAEVGAAAERLRRGPDVLPPREVAPAAPVPSATEGIVPGTPTGPRHPALRRTTVAAVAAVALVAAGALLVWRPWTPSAPAGTPEDIARAVVREMGADPVSSVPRPTPQTSNVTAWELYQRAAMPEALRSDSAAREALASVRRAAELDPSFAGAHASVARLLLRVGEPGMSMPERLQLAEAHAASAVGLDPSSAEAFATLGIAEMQQYDFERAEENLRRSVELDPRASRWREWLAQLYVWMGRYDEGLATARGALAVEPLSASARAEVARALLLSGRCGEALATLAPLASLEPPLLRAGPIAAQCHAQQGRWSEAVEDVRPAQLVSGDRGLAVSAYVLARAGRRDEAQALLEQLLAGFQGEGAFWIATAYAGLGDVDQAFAWLDRAVDDRSITFEIREPFWAQLSEDTRYAELLQRLGLH